jgi:predicted enzyme related to lactoylglutathione lyase
MSEARFVWYDLLTNDREAAVRFYGAVLGWGTQPFEVPGKEPYLMWTRNGVPIGGSMTMPPHELETGTKPHWLGYVAVDDVDASVEKAGSAGAKTLVPPTDIPTVGRFAVLQDPQGAFFAVFRSLQPSPPPGEPQEGDISWHELATSDVEAAFRFYHELLGWEESSRVEMGEAGTYLMFGTPMIGGMYVMPHVLGWLYYVRVGDLDATLERVRKHHGQVAHGPMEVPGGDRIAQCFDPQGGPFALHERKKRG